MHNIAVWTEWGGLMPIGVSAGACLVMGMAFLGTIWVVPAITEMRQPSQQGPWSLKSVGSFHSGRLHSFYFFILYNSSFWIWWLKASHGVGGYSLARYSAQGLTRLGAQCLTCFSPQDSFWSSFRLLAAIWFLWLSSQAVVFFFS